VLFAPCEWGTSINKSQKRDIGKKSQDILFSENRFCSFSVWVLLRPIPWVFWSENFTRHLSLCVLSFGWDLSPKFVPQDFQQIFFSSLPGLKGRFVCVWNCLTLFLGEYSSVWREICGVLSQIKSRFLRGISGKNYSGTHFVKNQGYSLEKFVTFRPTFCNFILCRKIALKNSHNYFHVMFAPCEGGMSINKSQKGDTGMKSQDILFSENRFCSTLGLGLTTPYSLGLLVWKFYQTFVIVCIEFWLRFEPEIRPTRFLTNFLFITARVERKVRLCVKLFDFFPSWILIRLTWNLWRFVPNSVQILTWNFRKKLFRDKFCEKPRLSSSSKICEISPYFL